MQEYKLTGFILSGSLTETQIRQCFPNAPQNPSSDEQIQIEHSDYHLIIEQSLIQAEATAYEALISQLLVLFEQSEVAFSMELFELDGRLIARYQG